mmetsp:Transcript_6977/g.13953  ORF Transcript_6977/g.13953 Transcript_6977/m.13953 type:complete len:524 (+) Transcript_6977:85-1656(+)|eukprot:CAMPEP_0171565510 /NCGR_PEP_ID=MMETSP0961-20121227/16_1 /TAXON_ID=87120 /ORGANISM="Aurantiochytrium limacinum, Strain ATCCMYA-1381" /LENGTH=523 /DNA_ID=CAMNT_0012119071 /DNA_START=60 /DNA_END=1631 /DNA_ORIENTATION=+
MGLVWSCYEAAVHVDAIFIVSSLANLAAGYNLAIAGHTLYLLESEGEELSEVETSMVASAAFVGAVMGQIVMGYMGERVGIVRGLVITFLILICGCLIGAFLCWTPNLLFKLAISRFIVGFGAGGVYPLAAIASSNDSLARARHPSNSGETATEHASSSGGDRFSGRRVMLTFSFQGVGQLLAPLWVLMLDWLLPHAKPLAWRVALLTGSIPAGFALGRMRRVLEQVVTGSDDNYSVDSGDTGDEQMSVHEDDENVRVIRDHNFGSRWSRSNLYKLLGTGGTWFLFDVLFYGNIVFSPFILNLVFHASEAEVAGLTTIVSAIALPGLYLASYYSDRLGRKQMQVFGFAMLTVLFLALAGLLNMGESSAKPFIFVLYCATFFFYNFGPNATTFCLPAETFDPEVRSFFHGLSAAMGKAGAFLGALFFKFVMDTTSLTFVMLCSSAVAAIAIALTIACVNVRRPAFEEASTRPSGMEAELPVRIPAQDDSHSQSDRPDIEYVDLDSTHRRRTLDRHSTSEDLLHI